MKEHINTSVLVIDDEEVVRDNIEEILVPEKNDPYTHAVDEAASILFDTKQARPVFQKNASNIPKFTVDKASNGMEGLALVQKAVGAGKPYAVIFLDMRMPGWDGVETAEQIRKYDRNAEIIFVTAFSDRSIHEVVARAGQNVGYHCKPYASEEITQLATKAVTDYNKLRNLEQLIDAISSISLEEIHLTSLLRNVLDQLATYVETDMALLGKLNNDGVYEKLFSIGSIEGRINLEELISRVRAANLSDQEVVQADEVVIARLDDYSIFAVLKKEQKLKTEKLYLLKLFVLNAARGIRNAELREKLLQKEKLSAVGKAMSMMMHDLRSPIKNISLLTDMMRKDGITSHWLDLIDQCGIQASGIFEDFLDFVKDSPVHKQALDLELVIRDGIARARAKTNAEQVLVSTDIPAGLKISGDPSKLTRCVMNLVNNSMEVLSGPAIANPRIMISVSPGNHSKDGITGEHSDRHNEHRSGGETVEISIRDNGPGIPSGIAQTLFEPFVTYQKAGGTGLGLAIVRQYVRAHGGDISVRNDNGAVFTITLPQSD